MIPSESAMETMRSQPQSGESLVVAIFDSIDEAGDAIRALQNDGYDMKKLSIVRKNYYIEEGVVGYYATGDRMMYWGRLGTFWGGFWGLIVGALSFSVPGIGQVLVAGPLALSIVEPGDSGEMCALGAGLSKIGIPMSRVLKYKTEVQNGNLLLVAHGSAAEVENAKNVLELTDLSSTTVHSDELATVGA